MYKDLEKKYGKWLVAYVVRKLKKETGRQPAYVEILTRLMGIR